MPAGCAGRTSPGRERCYLALERAASPARVAAGPRGQTTCTVSASAGWSPCNLQSAYELTSASAKDGSGRLVAVVDPYDDPNIAADLATFRTNFGLSACTAANKCFKKVNQTGQQKNYPTASASFAEEISLDVEMVSAICPNCHILLVEANSNGLGDLGTADNEAVKLGAKVVSNSWGTGEFNGETGYDGYFDHPGVPITFSSGDAAYQGGVQYPSASPYVTSVGGTQLTPATNSRGWTEAAWVGSGDPPTQGSGSGCSAYEPKPPWQTDTGCPNRMTADVSAVAANVLSYDSYQESGWFYSFGTSVSSPIIAATFALNKLSPSGTIAASAPYTTRSKLHDITSGSEGTCTPTYFCTAVKGYDGPTGLGTPNGPTDFKVAVTPAASISGVSISGTSSDPTITITGTSLDPIPPVGSPEPCQASDPNAGDNFGTTGLNISDSTQGWGGGQGGDCIGLELQSYSTTQVAFGFGDQYANYPPAQPGDSITVEVQGVTYTGTLTAST